MANHFMKNRSKDSLLASRRRREPETAAARQGGVTLIELLVVVTIIALFAALVGPRLFQHVGRSRTTAARAQINSFQTALGIYKLDTAQFPTTEQGLAALRVQPEGVERWDGPYLPQDAPDDPWGHPYVYRYPGEHGDEPDVISLGADGQPGGEGENADIVSWSSQ
jgi:general secretion pathway protein G